MSEQGWLKRNASVIEALAALVTACVAVAALWGAAVQISANDLVAREQSARETYRSHLTLAVAHPELAGPEDGCAILNSADAPAYTAFVDHLLYSAEQMLEVAEGWTATFEQGLAAHSAYLCSADGPVGETDKVAALLRQFRADTCADIAPCTAP